MSTREDELIPIAQTAMTSPAARASAQDKMERRKFDPIEKLMDLAEDLELKDKELDMPVFAEKRTKIYTTLAKFMHAQPKTVDVNVSTDNKFVIEAVSFSQLFEERKHMIPEAKAYGGPQLMGAVDVEAEQPDNA